MTTIRAADEVWAVGLTWHPPMKARKLRRAARDAGAVAFVETAAATGLAGDEDGDPTDTPALGAALIDHIEDPAWIAVVDGGPAGVVMVRCEHGAIGEEGDIVVDGAGEATRRLEASRSDLAVHASQTLGISGALPLDIASIGISDRHRLQPLPETGRGGTASTIVLGTIFAVLVGGGTAAWLYRQAIIDYIDPPPPVVEVEEEAERQVVAMIDTQALLSHCSAALRDIPPELPAWILDEVTCHAELVEAPVLAAAPDLRGRAAVVLHWSLDQDHDTAIHRRLIEALLDTTRHAGIVHERRAWAVTALPPVIVEVDPDLHQPEFLALRAAIDRRVGPWADSLTYAQLSAGTWSISITGRGPLNRFAAALRPIAGLEVTSLRRTAGRTWQIAARPLTTRTLLESAYLRLAQPADGFLPTPGHEGGS